MSHTLTRIALVAAISGAGLATAAAESPMAPLAPASVPGVDLSTPNFVRIAAQTDEFERTAGRLAEKDGDAQVRKFGARMVRDHTKTTDELKAAIRKAGMAVPPPPEMTTDQRQMLSELKGKTGAAFDRVYLKQAVETHKQALGLMEAYAAHGDSAPIAHAAKGAVPIVTEHLRMAERLAAGKPAEM